MNESNKPAKEMETLGEAALRLLGRLNERANKKPGAGDAPTNSEIDRARNGPCPVDGGPAVGGSRLALRLVANDNCGRGFISGGSSTMRSPASEADSNCGSHGRVLIVRASEIGE